MCGLHLTTARSAAGSPGAQWYGTRISANHFLGSDLNTSTGAAEVDQGVLGPISRKAAL